MKAKHRDIDEQLYQWLLEQRVSGHRVSGKCLKREALHNFDSDALLLGHLQLIEYLRYLF